MTVPRKRRASLLWGAVACYGMTLAHADTTFARPPASQNTCSKQQPRLPWGLSPLPATQKQQSVNFLEECQDFLAVLERPRGGSTYFGGGNGDDDDDRYDEYYPGDGGDWNDDYYGDSSRNSGYDDRGRSNGPSRRSSANGAGSFVDSLPAMFRNGDRRIGLSLLGSGTVITMLGISLFFNKALMRLGNLLFIAGVAITMGITRTMSFFLKPEKMRATICLGIGIFLVFIGSPVFGIVLEVFGLLNLFGNMFPMLMAIARTLPGIGPLLSNSNNSNKSKRSGRSYDDGRRRNDYYDDYPDDGGYSNDDGYYNEYYDDRGNSGGGYTRDDRYGNY